MFWSFSKDPLSLFSCHFVDRGLLCSLNAVASRENEFDSLQRRCGVGRDVSGNARIERQE